MIHQYINCGSLTEKMQEEWYTYQKYFPTLKMSTLPNHFASSGKKNLIHRYEIEKYNNTIHSENTDLHKDVSSKYLLHIFLHYPVYLCLLINNQNSNNYYETLQEIYFGFSH